MRIKALPPAPPTPITLIRAKVSNNGLICATASKVQIDISKIAVKTCPDRFAIENPRFSLTKIGTSLEQFCGRWIGRAEGSLPIKSIEISIGIDVIVYKLSLMYHKKKANTSFGLIICG